MRLNAEPTTPASAWSDAVAHHEDRRRLDGERDEARDLLELVLEPYGRIPPIHASDWREALPARKPELLPSAHTAFARSRSLNFWILPVEVLGSSMNTTWRGHL